ncbi:hypothetical protein [Parvibaculum sp. MBR-TMA-1.3b-4.2]|jgi:hypothetical protein
MGGDTFDTDLLEKFYAEISSGVGVDIEFLQERLGALFALDRTDADLTSYRLSNKPWKKLSDEVMPVSRFLRWREIKKGTIRFPLDNDPPDCWMWPANGAEAVGIEVTIAQGRERYHLAEELVERSIGRGFLGLNDDHPEDAFREARSRSRTMYSTEQALQVIRRSIEICLKKKNKPKFQGFDLLVEAPLNSLPRKRWSSVEPLLRSQAKNLPFERVFVVSGPGERPWGMQIK